jgi:exopolysaccharide biosynthesis polyprenyl glycosylphosphotransferase
MAIEDSQRAGSELERRGDARSSRSVFASRRVGAKGGRILGEEMFRAMLLQERRRAERSRKVFVLMLLDAASFVADGTVDKIMPQVQCTIMDSSRETDIVGWYKDGIVLGVIFTEVSLETREPITEVLRAKVTNALHQELKRSVTSRLVVTVHLFPENPEKGSSEPIADFKLYPDLSEEKSKRRLPILLKRVLDFVGSLAILLVASPLLFLIALAIKLTSKGPVVFRQERLGQFGSRFKCLKFRTMYVNNNPKIHQEYVQQFIAGQVGNGAKQSGKPIVYKITNDPRVTPVGRLLRKTSLDELPQFLNVLRGEMSLVGPRPPVPYEFEIYDIWHRRRVLEVKPGITGLWQVSGRSRICFDDMVRLDLRYAQSWSVWLDLKILMATPRAVINGEGAY